MSSLNDKLLNVTRTVNVYDNDSKNLIKEISMNASFERLRGIVTPMPNDPLLYQGYVLTREQLEKLSSYLQPQILANFHSEYYVLEAAGLYDW